MPEVVRHLGGIYLKEKETQADRDQIIRDINAEIHICYFAWEYAPEDRNAGILIRTASLAQARRNMQELPLKERTALLGFRVPFLSNCERLPKLVL